MLQKVGKYVLSMREDSLCPANPGKVGTTAHICIPVFLWTFILQEASYTQQKQQTLLQQGKGVHQHLRLPSHLTTCTPFQHMNTPCMHTRNNSLVQNIHTQTHTTKCDLLNITFNISKLDRLELRHNK